ncbi:GGDEF domain-containing protein [Hydrogenimonas sp.]
MASKSSIERFIESFCNDVEHIISEKKKRGESSTDIIYSIINLFFDKITGAGFSMDLDAYLEEEMERKSKKCFDIAQKSVESFKESNGNIKNITDSHVIKIEKITDETHEIDVKSFKKRIDEFQRDLIEELTRANNIIQSLENEIIELQKQSNIDPLTKLYNRKALKIDASELLKYSDERDLNIAVLMIDVDDFKQINDKFGHVAGDKVLILLSKLFKSLIRECDKAYRYGGEEFTILFNRAKREDALKIAQRILKAVRNNKVIYKNQVICITLSMGLTVHQKGDTLESMIERADTALYQAKREGKDRLVIR